eukprot:snap_masked-scaffold_6-processed-gene-10.10-mRNA-1 protein AED:1.00 eAED:1.00 QI:0/-1/0/0/-1/1/1/0/64
MNQLRFICAKLVLKKMIALRFLRKHNNLEMYKTVVYSIYDGDLFPQTDAFQMTCLMFPYQFLDT